MNFKHILFLTFLIFSSLTVFATTHNTIAAGDFDDPGIWDSGSVPTALDTINIYHGITDDDMPTYWDGVINVALAGTFFMDDYITFRNTASLIVDGVLLSSGDITVTDDAKATINATMSIGTDWILSGNARATIANATTTIGADWILSGNARATIVGGSTTISNDWILSGGARADLVGGTTTVSSDWILSGDARAEITNNACVIIGNLINVRDNSYILGNVDIGSITGIINFSGGASAANISDQISIYRVPDMNTCAEGCVVCSHILTGLQSGALPVELSYFRVTKTDCVNLLAWETQSEKDFSHFIVEKSFNGVDFFELTKVESRGSEEYGFTYDAEDSETKDAYYRLKMIDLDGSEEFSSVETTNECAINNSTIMLYPTLNKGTFNLFLGVSQDQNVEMVIFDSVGKTVHVENVQLTNGLNMIDVSVNLPSGNYILNIMVDDYTSIQRFIIL